MVVVGAGSGMVGFLFGQQSLKGITQPALNPFLNTAEALKDRPSQGVILAKERDIIDKVKKQISGDGKGNKPNSESKNSPSPKQSPEADAKPAEPSSPSDASTPASLPLTVEDQGMNLEVRSLAREADSLVLNVALTNKGAKPRQFLYSFLDVTDEQGQALFTEIRGLPAQLQPESETYLGTIRITDVPEGSIDQISMKLTDYPNQKLNLEILNIPIPQE